MKAISVWQPYASLIIHGFKINETRSWPIPKRFLGERIAIASTARPKPGQADIFDNKDFVRYYEQTNLHSFEKLPFGCVLGTAVVATCETVTESVVDMITEEEDLYGWFRPGYYAWGLRDPIAFEAPIPCRGAQGLWNWNEHGAEITSIHQTSGGRKARSAPGRSDLSNEVGAVYLFDGARAKRNKP